MVYGVKTIESGTSQQHPQGIGSIPKEPASNAQRAALQGLIATAVYAHVQFLLLTSASALASGCQAKHTLLRTDNPAECLL